MIIREINKFWFVVNLETDEVEKIFMSKNAALQWTQTNDTDEPNSTGTYCVVEVNHKEKQKEKQHVK